MTRNWQGSTIIELAAILWIVPILVLLCLNLCILVFGAWTCDAACRDAARAAGQQTGATWAQAKQNALRAAQGAVMPLAGVSYPFTRPTVVEPIQYWTYGLDDQGNVILSNTNGNGQGPYVVVTVKMMASLPCPVIWSSAGFTGQVNFIQAYTYPILNPPSEAGGP